MLNLWTTKSFAQQIMDAEMRLKRIELKFTKNSQRYQTAAKNLELQKKNYLKSQGKAREVARGQA